MRVRQSARVDLLEVTISPSIGIGWDWDWLGLGLLAGTKPFCEAGLLGPLPLRGPMRYLGFCAGPIHNRASRNSNKVNGDGSPMIV